MKYLKYLKESNKISFDTQITDAFIDLIDNDMAFIDEVSDDLCSILIKISKVHYEWEESLENNKNGFEITRKIKNILTTFNVKHSIKMHASPKVTTNNTNNNKLLNYNFLIIKFVKSNSQNELIVSNKGNTVYINNDILVDKLKSFGLELIYNEEDDCETTYYSNLIGFSIPKEKELTTKQKADISNLFINNKNKIEINFSENVYGEDKYITLGLSSYVGRYPSQGTGYTISPILV